MSRRNRNGPIRYRSHKSPRTFAKTGRLLIGRQLETDAERRAARNASETGLNSSKAGTRPASTRVPPAIVAFGPVSRNWRAAKRATSAMVKDHGGNSDALAVEQPVGQCGKRESHRRFDRQGAFLGGACIGCRRGEVSHVCATWLERRGCKPAPPTGGRIATNRHWLIAWELAFGERPWFAAPTIDRRCAIAGKAICKTSGFLCSFCAGALMRSQRGVRFDTGSGHLRLHTGPGHPSCPSSSVSVGS